MAVPRGRSLGGGPEALPLVPGQQPVPPRTPTGSLSLYPRPPGPPQTPGAGFPKRLDSEAIVAPKHPSATPGEKTAESRLHSRGEKLDALPPTVLEEPLKEENQKGRAFRPPIGSGFLYTRGL